MEVGRRADAEFSPGSRVYNAVCVRSGNVIWGWVDTGEGGVCTAVDELTLNLARGLKCGVREVLQCNLGVS